MSEEEEKPPFAAALRFLTDRERRLLADHPAPLELAAYHAGELSPEAEARLREHLALCRDCGDLLLDLAGVKKLTPPPGVPELTDEEVEEDWQAVRAKLGEKSTKEATKVAEVVPIRKAGAPPKPRRTFTPWLPLAASLLAVIGISWGLFQNQKVADLERKLALQQQLRGVDVLYLDQGTYRSGNDLALSISTQKETALGLLLESDVVYSAYEARVAGKTIMVAPPAGANQLVGLVIPPGLLSSGEHQIVLYGIAGDHRIEVGRYTLVVHES